MGELGNNGLFVPADPNITRFGLGHHVQRLTINNGFLMVEDPGVGDFAINDPLMVDLYTTPNSLRANSVSQLCKSMEDGTIPNLYSFTRLEGILAQHRLVEYFGNLQGLPPEHIKAIQIAVGLPDSGHPAFSHLAEQAIQKWGGPENFHDHNWPEIAGYGGTVDVLQRHGVQFDENIRVQGYDIPDWAERSQKPDLDVDNLQYIMGEALQWFDHDSAQPSVREKVKKAFNLENFEITPDGSMAVRTPEDALVISKLLMLFSTEHWNEPINRAHMHLKIHGMQRSIMERRLPWMDEVDRGELREPLGYYWGLDDDFTRALETGPGRADNFIYIVSNTLNSSGIEERRRFVDYKIEEYTRFVNDDLAECYPSQYLSPKRVEFGPKSSSVQTETIELTDEQKTALSQVKIPELDNGQDTLTYIAGPLKNRFIDPLVKVGDGEYVRLSQHDSAQGRAYAKLLAEHQQLQVLGCRVSFAFSPGYADEFREGMRHNDRSFNTIIPQPPMTPDQRRRVIEFGARRSVELGVASGRLLLKRELPLVS